jgi:hypothetical protein
MLGRQAERGVLFRSRLASPLFADICRLVGMHFARGNTREQGHSEAKGSRYLAPPYEHAGQRRCAPTSRVPDEFQRRPAMANTTATPRRRCR